MNEPSQDLARLRSYIDKAVSEGVTQLPAEPRLSEELAVSRGRLRTLLKKVESEGLIWRHVGKGTFIGPRELEISAPTWADGFSLADIMDARQVLEPQLAAQAAIKARTVDHNALEHCLTQMQGADTYIHWKKLDERLHRTIAEATHNALLLVLYDTLRAHGRSTLDPRVEEVFRNQQTPRQTDEQHKAIVDAIRARNPERAEREMRLHLSQVREKLFGIM